MPSLHARIAGRTDRQPQSHPVGELKDAISLILLSISLPQGNQWCCSVLQHYRAWPKFPRPHHSSRLTCLSSSSPALWRRATILLMASSAERDPTLPPALSSSPRCSKGTALPVYPLLKYPPTVCIHLHPSTPHFSLLPRASLSSASKNPPPAFEFLSPQIKP